MSTRFRQTGISVSPRFTPPPPPMGIEPPMAELISQAVDAIQEASAGTGFLDLQIHTALFGAAVPGREPSAFWHYKFTRSVDDALALVPQGWDWEVKSNLRIGRKTFSAKVDNLHRNWAARRVSEGDSCTQAMAICLAALRGRHHELKYPTAEAARS